MPPTSITESMTNLALVVAEILPYSVLLDKQYVDIKRAAKMLVLVLNKDTLPQALRIVTLSLFWKSNKELKRAIAFSPKGKQKKPQQSPTCRRQLSMSWLR
jgi:hypothetical protein